MKNERRIHPAKRKLVSVVFTLTFPFQLLGCSNNPGDVSYRDGTYIGRSGEDDQGAYGEARITIEAGSITQTEYVTRQRDGSIKDESYGLASGEIAYQDYYDRAQLAVSAMRQYAERLAEVQKLEDVDAISGATISYNQFLEAATDALDQAKA